MKRIISFFFVAMLAGQAWAQTTFEVNGLKYTVTDEQNSYVSVAKSSREEPKGDLIINGKISKFGRTYKVVSIENMAFGDCSDLRTISIPNSVTTIGNNAFSGCRGLTSITIGSSVTRIGENAFSDCNNLFKAEFASIESLCGMEILSAPFEISSAYCYLQNKTTQLYIDGIEVHDLVIPASVTSIGDKAFRGCSGITSVTISEGVTNIGNSAFVDCINLTSVAIPNSVTSIGYRAFFNCSGLISVNYAEGSQLTSIGSCAFEGCSGLTSVTIPKSVTSIGKGAFSGCSSLQSITLPFVGDRAHTPEDTEQYPFGYIFGTSSYPGGTATSQYGPNSIITEYYIPTSLKDVIITGSEHITKGAFDNCTDLTSITIPNSVTNIGQEAFAGCSGLISLIFAEGSQLDIINDGAFYGCSKLTSVTIPNSVTSIGDYAFIGCSGLASVTIGNSVTSIGYRAFGDCRGLTSVIFAEGSQLTYIHELAFSGCSLTSVTIPNSVKSIGGDAFNNCISLTSLIFSEGSQLDIINERAFYGCSNLISVTIPNSVTSIGREAFASCSGLISVTIGNSVTSIGYRAFGDCRGLTSLIFAEGSQLDIINERAFYGCSNLISVTIPSSVTSIGGYTFYGCSGLISVTIPSSVTSIGREAFAGCSKLTAINVESDNTKYTSQDGVLFNKDKTIIVCYPTDKTGTSYTIPESITNIDYSAFEGCKHLSSVTIPNSVEIISGGAFKGCTGLKSVTIPNSVTLIGAGAFSECSSLTSITIPESVTSIYPTMFIGCCALTSVTIPGTVTSIRDHAFYGCSSLTSICYEGNSNPTHNGSFDYVATTIPVCVPVDYAYDNWCGFTNLIKGHNKVTDNAVAATCTETGLTEGSHCSYCGKVLVAQDVIPAKGHSYDNTVTSSTCTAIGYTTHICSVCNHTFNSDTVPANGHKPDSIVFENIVAATCIVAGSQDSVVYCSVCQTELSRNALVISASGHSYSANVVAPTCTAEGYTVNTCSVCNHTYNSDTVPANGHTPDSIVFENIVAATCTVAGSQDSVVYCSVCQTELSRNALVISATGHSYSTNDVTPTCTAVGYTTHTCSACNHTYNSDTVPANGHTPDSIVFENIVAATCTVAGSQDSVVYCSVCKTELSRNALVISASGHSYSTNDVAPTCTAIGYTTHICSVCNHTYNSDSVPANGHKPDSIVFENIVAATCTVAGSQDSVVYCSSCKTELSRNALVIPASGHSYSSNVVVPTCTAVGYTTHTCSVCNHTFNSDTVPAKGHTAVVDSAVAATATSEGLTEGSHCSVCGETILAQVVIPALGEQGGDDNQGGTENESENGNQGGNEGQEGNEPEGENEPEGGNENGNENQGGNNEGNGNESGNENQGGEIIEPATAVADDAASAVNIFAHHNIIVVENADAEIRVYNIMGGLVATANETNAEIRINVSGVYVVRVGNTAKRVMISD